MSGFIVSSLPERTIAPDIELLQKYIAAESASNTIAFQMESLFNGMLAFSLISAGHTAEVTSSLLSNRSLQEIRNAKNRNGSSFIVGINIISNFHLFNLGFESRNLDSFLDVNCL